MQTFKGIAELRESQAKTSEELRISQAKTDAQLAKTDAKLDKVAKMLGNIGNNQGDVAEEFFYNSLNHKKDLAGIHYDYVGKNWQHDINKVRDEFDIVMLNGKDIAIIEVKYKAHEADLEKLLTKKYQNFKTLYPTYKDFNHHLALATFHINEEFKEKALSSGVMVLQRKGDMIETFV